MLTPGYFSRASVTNSTHQDEGSGTSLVPLRIVVSGVYQFAKRKVHIVYPVVLFQSSQDGKSYELASLIYIQLRTARMIRRITQTSSFISVPHMRQSEGCSVADRKFSISLHHLPSPDQSYARTQCRFASLRNPLHEEDDVAVAAASRIVQEPPVTRCV